MDGRSVRRQSDTQGSRIRPEVWLVVDEPEMRTYLRGCLTALPYHIVEFCDATDVLRIRERQAPRVVLIIIRLSDQEMSGAQLCRELDSDPGSVRVPVLLISGESRHPTFGVGLREPFNARKLMQAVRTALALSGGGVND